MRLIIQISFIAIAAVFVLIILRNPEAQRSKAWKKLAFIGVILFMIATVIHPSVTDSIAHAMGVESGANLLLYVLTLGYIMVSLNAYLIFKRINQNITILTREIAILKASQEPVRASLSKAKPKPKRDGGNN